MFKMPEFEKIEFKKIHTKKKRLLLTEMMREVASQTAENFEGEQQLGQCPCCGSRAIEFYCNKFGYRMDKCNSCYHIFTNPMPGPQALSYFYNSKFKDFENEFFLDSFESRIPIFEQRLKLLEKLDSGRRILDVGSAVGIFLAANAKCDSPFEIAACDISKNACDILKGKFPETQVFNKNVMDLGPSDYDIVTLWDTFEHITDPINLFEAISSQLRRDGLFVFSTPNTSSFEWIICYI